MKIQRKWNELPRISKELRDKILNYTDDTSHQSFTKMLDSKTMYKILAGAKNVSKSFGCAVEIIYRILNDKNYNAVVGRNLFKDIARTINPTFRQVFNFMESKHNIELEPYFDVYINQIYYKPTGQGIYFGNFENPNSFAGITLPKSEFYFGDLVLDEIQQNPIDLGDSKVFSYETQEADLEFILQSTILRYPGNQQRRVIFTFNIYDSDHWVCNRFLKKLIPFNEENRNELIEKTYIMREDAELNCSAMRMSRFYVPKETIMSEQLKYYENLKLTNPKLYDITVAGESYDIENPKDIAVYKKYLIGADLGDYLVEDIANIKYQMVIDGFDPGLKDKNGFSRVLLTDNFEIVVVYSEEIESKDFSNFKRHSISQYVLQKIQTLNKIMNTNNTILAIDSKEDTIKEILNKYIIENDYDVSVVNAIKNKNENFSMDFNIVNRIRFFKECFEKKIIKFSGQCYEKCINYFKKITVNENGVRNEKLNPEIYDLINAIEYAVSIIYPIVIANSLVNEVNNQWLN